MTDLVEWLETAISGVEDRQRRRTVSRFNYGISCPTCGRKNASVIQVTQDRVVTLACGCMFEGGQADQLWVTAPTPDATWVFRRCAADRKILALHRPVSRWPGDGCYTSCDGDDRTVTKYPCATVLALAEGYGYQEEAKS